ncbi:MAG: hypothetical protein AB7I19_13180 [Planctomycetota bacterium]
MRAPESGMARRNNFLVVTLLVMVAVLIGAILLWNGSGDPEQPTLDPKSPTVASGGAASGEIVAGDGGRGRTAEDDASAANPASRSTVPAADPNPAATQERLTGRIVDENEQPRSGVPIRWEPGQRGVLIRMPRGGDRASGEVEVATDANGRFEIVADLSGGGGVTLDRRSGIVFATTGLRSLRVDPTASDTDLGTVKTVGGWSLSGRVVDEQGLGIPSATLRVSEDGHVFGLVTTDLAVDGEGRFEVLGLEHRDVFVSAYANGFIPHRRRVEFIAGGTAPQVEIKLNRGAAIAGMVTDDLGLPLEGARIGLLRHERIEGGIEVQQIHGLESVLTDERGAFVVSGIDGQTASIRISKPGYAAESMTSVPIGRNDLLIRLPRLASIAGVLTDFAGKPLEGSEVRASASADVADSGPRFELDGIHDTGRNRTATTDVDGKFLIEGVRPGPVTLVATGDSHLSTVSAPMQALPGTAIEHVKLVAETGASIDVQVVDAAGRPVADAEVEVSQPSAHESVGPAHGARRIARSIRARSGGAPDLRIAGMAMPLRTGRTGADGHVVLTGLPAGAVAVSATHEEHAASRAIETVLPQRGRVEAIATLRQAGFVAIEVVDTAGAPVEGISILLRGPSGDDSEEHTARSGSAGTAKVGPLLPGRYDAVLELPPVPTTMGGMQIVMDRNGGEIDSSRCSIEVRAGETTQTRLQRPILTRLHGVVTDASGVVNGVEVRLNRVDDGEDAIPMIGGRSATSDVEGRFEFVDIPAGRWELQWRRKSRPVFARTTIDIAPDLAELRQDLAISGANVRVRVVSATDQLPLSRARVRLVPADAEGQSPRPARRARFAMVMISREENDDSDSTQQMTLDGDVEPLRTDDDGVVVFTEVPFGDYIAEVQHDKHVDGRSGRISVAGDSDAGTVALTGAGSIRGKIKAAEGADTEIATVTIRKVGGSESDERRETAMNGAFRVDRLAAGDYELRATPIGAEGENAAGPPQVVTVRTGEISRVELSVRR